MLSASSIYVRAVSSAAFVGVSSLAFIALLIGQKKLLQRAIKILVGLAAGALTGNAFFHLLPEIFQHGRRVVPVLSVAGGVVLFVIIEKSLSHADLEGRDPKGYVILIGDTLHNIIDGILIGASFFSGTTVGVATTIAVLLHEIPHEIGVFGVMLNSGFSVRTAFLANVGIEVSGVAAAALSVFFGAHTEHFTTVALGITAGGFLYIAAAELLPRIIAETDTRVRKQQVMALLAGLALMMWRD